MSEKKYLLTKDELFEIAWEANAAGLNGEERRFDSGWLAAHEHRERTCRAIYDGDDSGHEFAGKSWHCSNCGHEMDEYEAKCGVYCIICGSEVVDE